MIRRSTLQGTTAGVVLAFASLAAWAGIDEAWLHRAVVPAGLEPLLVLLLDDSDAASANVAARPAYEPDRDYALLVPAAERCDPARVYWRRGAGPRPHCAAQAGLALHGDGDERGFHCLAARTALSRSGFFVASRAAQWRRERGWGALAEADDGAVECRGDRGVHGSASGAWFAADETSAPWSGDAGVEIRWDRTPLADPYIFYLGNYLNYLHAPLPTRAVPVAALARESMAAALRATDDLTAALIRLADGTTAGGGYVSLAEAPAAVAATRVELRSPTPDATLAEALAEAATWLAGGVPHTGRTASADPAAFDAATGRYRTPFTHACRPVTLAMLTAGLPSGDERAAEAAALLPGFTETTGGCAADCLGTLARFLQEGDLLDDLPARQSAQFFWIAPASGGSAHLAGAVAGATAAAEEPLSYVNLVALSHQLDAAVAAGPALSAAGLIAVSPTSHEPAAVFSMTAPRARERWRGNAFRYRLRAPESPLASPDIVDQDGEAVIDPATGLPRPATRSDWSNAPDADLLAGGATSRLPDASARRIFSDLVSGELTDPRNRLVPGNSGIDRARVGLGAGDPETVPDVIAWLRALRPIGDPGTHPPVIVPYPGQDLTTAFIATQDGMLHALDAASGVERWAWMPGVFLPRLAGLMRNLPTTARSHGFDGRIIVHRFDPDGDGVIEADSGEHLWLLLSHMRGGASYYALDVADPQTPRLLWFHESGDDSMPSAPEPVVARLATGDASQSAGKWIVMLASGNSLRVLDADNGRLLWTAGASAGELRVPALTAPLASAPRVLDLDGDGHLDRTYLLDERGGLWRFDFSPGAPSADFARVRRIARLGDGTRHFQSSPDVAIITLRGRREIAIAAGSGRIERPRETADIDRAYVILDREGAGELADSDLHDATSGVSAMPSASSGWYLRLENHGPGEKVAGPAVTFDHRLRFQTFQPLPARSDEPCGPPRAMHRLYARDIRTGLPAGTVRWPEGDEELELELEAPGLPVELRFAFPAPAEATCPGCRSRSFGLAGPRIFDPGYAGDPVRTSWRELPPDSR